MQGLLAVDPVGVGGVGDPGGGWRPAPRAATTILRSARSVTRCSQCDTLRSTLPWCSDGSGALGQQCVDGLAAVMPTSPWGGLVPRSRSGRPESAAPRWPVPAPGWPRRASAACQHRIEAAKVKLVVGFVPAQVQVDGAVGRSHGLFEQQQALQQRGLARTSCCPAAW